MKEINEKYKEEFRKALEKQKQTPISKQQMLQQFMKANGLKKLVKASLEDLLKNNKD